MPAPQWSPARTDERDFALDLLRAIAIIEVIFAHARPPPLLDQLRNFGVPFLILLSGMSFARYAAAHEVTWLSYVVRRIRKLVLPTWVFITAYVAGWSAIAPIMGWRPPFTGAYVLQSYLLVGGISLLWVIRVNLLVSLVTPALLRVERALARNGHYLLFCGLLFTLSFVPNDYYRRSLGHFLSDDARFVFQMTVAYMLPYAAIFAIGMRVERLTTAQILLLAGLFLAIFAGYAVAKGALGGTFVPTQEYKYPPGLYYIAYAMFVSLLLVAVRHRIAALVTNERLRALVSFIGANTLLIYLYHIPVLDLEARLVAAGYLPDQFLVQWAAMVVVTVSAVALHRAAWRRLRQGRG